MSTFVQQYLSETAEIIRRLDVAAIENAAQALARARDGGGRLFILGVGGGAGHAGHAVNDFRKLCAFEAYAPTDNVSELTARTNDEGWDTTFEAWLRTSRIADRDAVLVMSVGGGSPERQVSMNIVKGLQVAKAAGATIVGIVGRDGGYAKTVATACVVVPIVNPDHVTPHTEAMQAVVWHLLVTHPALKKNQTKW